MTLLENLHHLHFIRPQWLWALLPVMLLIAWYHRRCRYGDVHNWQKACDAHLLPYITVKQRSKKAYGAYIPTICLSLGWLFAVLALSGPSWRQIPQPLYQRSQARVIVLDLSPAMLAKDIAPNRMQRARYKIKDLLQAKPGDQWGLLVFTNEPYVVSPLTDDGHTIEALLSALNPRIMPVSGHDLARALKRAGEMLTDGGQRKGEVIVMTPGPVTKNDIAAAKKLYHHNIRVSVLGIGSQLGAPIPTINGHYQSGSNGTVTVSQLDSDGLQRLAIAGGGTYVKFNNSDKDIERLLINGILREGNNKAKLSNSYGNLWQDEGPWFLLVCVLLASLLARRGWFEY